MDTDYRCKCGATIDFRVVKKEGPNTGREFCNCYKCGKFYWKDSKNYDTDKFKNGSCFRCGNYGHDIFDCKENFDWFGNLIPETDSL